MHRIPAKRHPKQKLIGLVLAAAISLGGYGHVVAQAGSQEVRLLSLSEGPQTPQEAETPALMRRAFLPVIDGMWSSAQQLIAAINAAREQAGCAPLHVDGRLMDAAQVHSEDMARHAFLEHEGSDGSLPADRVTRAGYPMAYVGEAIMREEEGDAGHVVSHWMESEAHRVILLRCTTQDTGAGYSAPYWTVVVGNHF